MSVRVWLRKLHQASSPGPWDRVPRDWSSGSQMLADTNFVIAAHRHWPSLVDLAEAVANLRDAEYDHGRGSANPDTDEVDAADEAVWAALAALEAGIVREDTR